MRFTEERDMDKGQRLQEQVQEPKKWTAATVTGGGDIGMASDLC